MKIGISTLIVRPNKSASNEAYLIGLIDALLRYDQKNAYTLYVTPQNKVRFRQMEWDGVTYHTMPKIVNNRFVRIIFDQFVIPIFALIHRLDVLHYPGTIGSIWGIKRTVVSIHYELDKFHLPSVSLLKRIYFKGLFKLSCKRASSLIVPTNTFAKSISREWGIPIEKMWVGVYGSENEKNIDNILIEQACRNAGLKPGFILSVTNELPHKNLIRVLDVYLKLRDQTPATMQLVLIGNISSQYLEKYFEGIRAAGKDITYENDIINLGFVPNEQVLPFYNKAAMLLNPSLSESLGITVIEAMNGGCPVIASNIPAHKEIIDDAGILIEEDNSEQYMTAMIAMLGDPGVRKLYIEKGRERAALFSWEHVADNTVSAYNNAAGVAKAR